MSKQYLFIPALILAILTIVGATAAVQADNTLSASISSENTVNVNESITFAVQVTGGTGFYDYTWDFGDGTIAGGQSPSHTFTSSGSKTVTVAVIDTAGSQTSASKTIEVNVAQLPLLITITSPSDNATFNVNESIDFVAQVTGGTGSYDYTWSFGDGTQVGGQSPSHTFTSSGSKTVTVAVIDTANNQDSDSINLTIEGGTVTPAPTVTFTANGQTSLSNISTTTVVTLAWTSTNATSCTASGDWSGAKATSGSEDVGPFAVSSSRTFTLTCTGAGGSTARTITVTTTGGEVTNLVISNVRVTDITRNSAIVRWDTNLPANSRVIYDTVSHPNISGQSAPNYGYQFSTGTDSALVTSHAVTVSGLSANTRYFFRVISEN